MKGRRNKNLSDDRGFQDETGKVGSVVRTVAFMGPLIFMAAADGMQ